MAFNNFRLHMVPVNDDDNYANGGRKWVNWTWPIAMIQKLLIFLLRTSTRERERRCNAIMMLHQKLPKKSTKLPNANTTANLMIPKTANDPKVAYFFVCLEHRKR